MPPPDPAPHRRLNPTWLAAGLLWAAGLGLFALGPRPGSGGAAAPASAEERALAADAPGVTSDAAAVAALDALDTLDASQGQGNEATGSVAESESASGAPGPIGAADGLPTPSGDALEAAAENPPDAAAEAGAVDASAAQPSGVPGSPAGDVAVAPAGGAGPGASSELATGPTEPPGASATPEPPTDIPPTPTVGPPPAAAELPGVPAIDGAMQARLKAIWDQGQGFGRRGDVFAKVGDSLTVSGFFLTGLGCDTSRLGAREDLRPILDLYRAAEVPPGASVAPCAAANSLTRRPVSAGTGWLAAQVLAPLRGDVPPECAPPNDTALHCEVALLQPSVAIVTLGTNDVHTNNGVERFGGALGRVVDELAALGVIPLVSTIPPRTDRAAMAERTNRFNDVVVRVATERQVPLVNLWRELSVEGLVRGGMEPDGIHLNAVGYGASFTEAGLRYGQNRRNALVLDALAKVRRVGVEGGAGDGG